MQFLRRISINILFRPVLDNLCRGNWPYTVFYRVNVIDLGVNLSLALYPLALSLSPITELVKNFKCFLYSKAMNCSWLLTNQVPEDLQLYYG